MHPTARLLACCLPLLAPAVAAQSTGPDPARARQYFEEARARCADDGGKLWGRDLFGPMIFADNAARVLVASAPDKESRLAARDGVWSGPLPADLVTANTALDWAGVHWTMVNWPLPSRAVDRARLMTHELYHHVQEQLGLPARNAICGHLDTLEGRIWLQLEWRALADALRDARHALVTARHDDPSAQSAAAAARDADITDALLFRRARRAQLPDAAAPERMLELNEGLAEYTGIKLSGLSDAEALGELADSLPEQAAALASYARSWAYESGPAWGLLLDQVADGWRAHLTLDSDLGELCGAAVHAQLPAPDALLAAANARAAAHDGAALRATEEAREQRRQQELARWRAALVDGPVLELPLSDAMNYGFDPNNVLAMEGLGTVYPTGTLHDAWGALSVDGGGMLIAADGRHAFVAAPSQRAPSADGKLRGAGWELQPAPGWDVADGTRAGDARLRKR